VVVPPVEEGHLDVDISKCTRCVQSSEAAPDDYDVHVSTILRADTVGLLVRWPPEQDGLAEHTLHSYST
jgi:hypothetical protein